MNHLLLRLIVLPIPLLLISFPVKAQPGQRYYLCESPNLSLSLPPGVPDGTASSMFFVSTRLRDSSGGLTFHNLFKRKIVGLELLVQYLDENSHPLAQISYIATTADAQQKFHGQLRSEATKELKKGIPPSKALYMIGESFTVVRNCPVKANLMFLHILFEDARTAQWEMSGWKTEPVIRDLPLTVEFLCESNNLSTDVYLRVRVSREGRVSNIQRLAFPHWACLDNLRKTLESWIFYPALQNGNPSDSELDILLRFDREGRKKKENWGWVSPQEIREPTVIVDFVQTNATPTEWVIVYGPRPFGFTPN